LYELLNQKRTALPAVSDGGADVPNNYGSFGWVLGANHEILWEGKGIARCYPIQSYRAEGYGRISLLSFCRSLHLHTKKEESCAGPAIMEPRWFLSLFLPDTVELLFPTELQSEQAFDRTHSVSLLPLYSSFCLFLVSLSQMAAMEQDFDGIHSASLLFLLVFLFICLFRGFGAGFRSNALSFVSGRFVIGCNSSSDSPSDLRAATLSEVTL
jgi:hypothetical protein